VYTVSPVAVGVTSSVPVAACVPVHPPLAVHAVLDDHESVALCPSVMVVGSTESAAVAAGLPPPPPYPPPPPPPQPASAPASAVKAMNQEHFDATARCLSMTGTSFL
jgi:hypothetical protein